MKHLISPNEQEIILKNALINYYKINDEQLYYRSHSFYNNTITIKFRVKVNKNTDALQVVHLTRSTFNNDCCIKDNNNSGLIDYVVESFNEILNADLKLELIENLNITSKSKIISVDPEKSPPKVTVWTIFPSNKYQKTYYFDDPDAWTNNQVPQNGKI